MPEIFQLPMVEGTDSIDHALDKIRSAPQSGVVVRYRDGTMSAETAADILKAKRRGIARLEQTRPKGYKVVAPKAPVDHTSMPDEEMVREVFGTSRARFALLDKGKTAARILSRRESFFTLAFDAGVQCACMNCNYNGTSPPIQNGQECPSCRRRTILCT